MRDDIFNDCLLTQEEFSGTGKPFWKDLAEKWGYNSMEKLRAEFRREKKKRGLGSKSVDFDEPVAGSTYQETDDYINIIYANTPLKTKEDVIREYNIDMTKWEIAFFEVKPSQGYRKDRKVNWKVRNGVIIEGDVDDSGKMLVVQLYNLRIKFVPITVEGLTLDNIVEFYKSKNLVTQIKFPKFKPSLDRILDINTGDWHIGARWFDRNESNVEEIFSGMFADILERIERDSIGFTKIYFNLIGDIAHYQNRKQETERHGQAVEGNGMNPLEIFDLASSLCISSINKLLDIAPVEMLYIPGNHDGDMLYQLLCRMQSHFHTVDSFKVDLGYSSRKARLFGKNLRGWEHGEMQKKNKVHWLQNDFRELWGQSLYAETFSGHWHHEEVIENGGVKTRTCPAVAVTDFWHHRNGYVGSVRATMSFVWEKDRLGWADTWQSTGVKY